MRWNVVLIALAGTTPVTAADLGAKTGLLNAPFLQWSVPNPTVEGNPFDLSAVVEFTHRGSGAKRRTELFFEGGDRWAFRFAGTEVGEWSFATSCDADKDLDGHVGSVVIAPNPRAGAHGFLQNIGGKWGWEATGEVFAPQLVMWDYIAGDSNPKAFFAKPDLIDAKIAEFIVGHGFTGFHLPVIAGRWFDLDADSERVSKAMADPDPRTFEALELLIGKTHRAGGMVHIWPWGDDSRSQTPRSLQGGIGGVIDRRLQRYIAARLVPGWSMGYGFDLDEWVSADQVRAWRDNMHRHLGWGHLLGGRPVGPNRGLDHAQDAQWNRGLDYSSYEHHRPTYEVYLAAIAATPGRPVMSEDRFRIRERRYPEKDYDTELTRRGLYHSSMAGGVANIWGIDPDLSPGGVFPIKDQFRTYATFFNGRRRFLPDMTPANELSGDPDTRILVSRAAGSLVAYRESTDAIQIDLGGMAKPTPVVAVDTMRAYAEIDLGQLPPNKQTVRLPAKSDWIIAVGDFESEAERAKPKREAAKLSFTDVWRGPALNGGHGAMWGDVDGDALPDLYLPLIISGTLPDLFLHNLGGGVFAEEGERRGIADPDGGSHGAAWCDLDNDGDFDLINGTTFDDGSGIQNDVFRNDGGGTFVELKPAAIESRQEATRAFLSFDMDRDGDLDLFGVSNYQGSTDPPDEMNEVYRNDGEFRFTAITEGALFAAPAGQGATDTDYDGDGDIDVLAANRSGPVNILTNDGNGNFTATDPASVGIRHRAEDGITSADIDNDGDLDLLLAGSSGTAQLYVNEGRGAYRHGQAFAEIVGYMGGFADLDNDGDLDLYFAGDQKIYLNDGGGRFSPGPLVELEGGDDPRGVAFADFDNDGDIDFAVGDKRAKRNYILRNDLRGGGNWLKVRLVAPNGQAGAFGAKTSIYAAGDAGGELLGMRESQSNCGYLGQNDPVLHFGLGDRTEVDVVVRFLDGSVTTRRRAPANRILLIDASGSE